MKLKSKIVPCLWFDGQAEPAARFYTSIFPDSKILQVNRFTEAGHDVHGRPAGSVMTVSFELAGQPFTALNGGPLFHFTEAVSFQVMCDTQDEIDHYWSRLSEAGQEVQCGWLKDQFGLSWQVVPSMLSDLFTNADPARAKRVMEVMLKMTKMNIAELQQA